MSRTGTCLGEIFDIERGGSPRPIQHYLTDDLDGVPWIMIGDTKAGGKYIDCTRSRIKRDGIRNSREVFPGELLLSNSMSFGRPYILRTYGCIHDGWLVLKPKRDDIDIDYAYHALGSSQAMAQFQKQAAGATVKNLNKEIVASAQIPLPPLEEQRRIAAILDHAASISDAQARALELRGAMKESLFEDAFCLRGRSAVTIGADIPSHENGWEWKLLTDVASLATGHTPDRGSGHYWGGDIPWITLGDIRELDGCHAYATKEMTTPEGIANSEAASSQSSMVAIQVDACTRLNQT